MTKEEMNKKVYPAVVDNNEDYAKFLTLKKYLPKDAYEILAKNHNEKKEKKEWRKYLS